MGLAAAVLAKKRGVTVAATTRQPDREELLRANGADHVFIDSGDIAGDVRRVFEGGVDRVLELVGTTTLLDSLRCVGRHGVVCMTGIVGNQWSFDRFAPFEAVPTTASLTTYAGESSDFMRTPLQEFVNEIEEGRTQVKLGPVFRFHEIVEAHRAIEDNTARGKLVVVSD